MDIYPKTFQGIERYFLVSIITALSTILIFGNTEGRAIQSMTIHWGRDAEQLIVILMLVFIGFSLTRGIYLKLMRKENTWLYALAALLSALTIPILGTVIEC